MLDKDLVLPHLLAKRAATEPDRVFFQQVDGPELTYGQLQEGILTWADAFRRAGVEAFENVACMMPTNVEAYYVWMGLAWLRAVEVPMNTMYRGKMLQYIADNSDAKVLVVGSEFIDRLEEVASDLPKVTTVIVPDSDDVKVKLPFKVITRSAFLGDAKPATDLPGSEYHDVSCIIYTSGTTGPSKGVLVPWPELYWFDVYQAGDWGPDDASYMFLPPYHVSGKLNLYLTAKHNMRCVMRAGFSLTEFWNDIKRYNCTNVGLLGPLARLLLLNPESPDDADNPIQTATCGPLFPEVDAFKKRFGLELGTGYGMTEIGAVTSTEGTNIEDWRSCGKVRTGGPGYQLRVVDSNDEEVPVGTVGELIVRTDVPWTMNLGYYGMPEKTAEAWRNGWFHTGDGFKVDGRGNYFFVDRLKDAIRRRGENISSFEVEGYVNEHPDVTESAAIGVPSELGEDDVKVCVVRKPDSTLTEPELIEFLIPNMPKFMIPRYIEFVEAFPKTEATARTKKVDLRDGALNDNTWDRDAAGIKLPKD